MGIALILVSCVAGYCLLKQFCKYSSPMCSLCGATLVGCLLSGTLLYLGDLFFVKSFGDYSNGFFAFFAVAAGYIIYAFKRIEPLAQFRSEIKLLRQDHISLGVFVVVLIFSVWLNWHSLNTNTNGNILVANGAWSDLMYHLAYVRSVAIGNNVPIQYPYFANEPIRYHFLFDYFTGKVSQLGVDSVQALNLMSTLALTSLLMLVFEFGRVVFKSALTGILGVVFLVFHSSLSVFPWLKENFGPQLLQRMFAKDGWLNGAELEVWGLFNLNVFVNQRHFAFGLATLVLIALTLVHFTESARKDAVLGVPSSVGFKRWLREYENLKFPLFWGIVVGCMPFWNALFAVIGVAFLVGFALLHYRNPNILYPLIVAALVASVIVYPQLMLFKQGASALAGYPRVHFGYGVENGSLIGTVLYYLRIFGLKVVLIGLSLVLLDRQRQLYSLIFLIPFVIANLFQLSSVLYDNNKLIFASVALLNCYAAYSIAYLLKKHSPARIIGSVLLVTLLTLSGVIDFFAVKNLKNAEVSDQTSSVKWWVVRNTKPRSVFLTNTSIPFADNAISALSLAGRYLYVVSNCVASSCVVDPRIETARKIYSFEGGTEQVKSLLKNEKIDYVLVDEHVRSNSLLGLNERALIENLKVVYKDESIKIFSVP